MPTEQNPTSRRAALIVATASSFLTPFMGSSVNIALPSLGRDLGLDAVSLGWVATSYLLAAGIFLLPFGRWADITGRKRLFMVGLVVYSLGSLATALAATLPLLLSARVLQGVGAAMVFGTSIAIVTSVFPPGERGRVLGITVAAVYTGLAAGPFIGGLLTEAFGWRSVFLVNVPVGVLCFALAGLGLKGEWAEARGEAFDLPGAVLYSASLAVLMVGMSRLPAFTGAALVAGGLGGLALFALWEARVPSPLLNVALLTRNRVFALSNLAALINYCATTASTFLLSLFLQYLQGMSPRQAGMVLLIQPVMQAVLSPFAGRLSDRGEPRVIASAGMGLTAGGLGLLTLLGHNTGIPFIAACLVLLGIGFALFSSPNTNAVMGAVERRFYGVASGTLGTMRLTGQMLSMGFVMVMLSAYVGKTQITAQTHPQFLQCARASFVFFSLLCCAGILASLARGSTKQPQPPEEMPSVPPDPPDR